jgi:MFS family permease
MTPELPVGQSADTCLDTGISLRRAWATLGLLGLLYILSFIDRTILALLVEPLRADLGLTDVQLGLLFGSIFALFYAVTSLPLARLADRYNRKHLIMAGVIFWSICTVGSAFARNFTELAALRIGLAIGEAALTPAAFSLIADTFPPSRRIFASTMFSLSGMLGSASSYLAGGLLVGLLTTATAEGWIPAWPAWKYVLVTVGTPGIVVVLLLGVVARETRRNHAAPPKEEGRTKHLMAYLGSRKALFLNMFIGAGLGQIVCNAAIAWGPTYLQRDFAYSVANSGYGFGLAQAFGAIGGTFTVAHVIRKLIERKRYELVSRTPVVGACIGCAIIIAGVATHNATFFLFAYAIGSFLLIGVNNAIIIILQVIVPGSVRATLTALAFICISSLALGIGPPLTAFLAGQFGGHLAIGLVGTALCSLFGTLIFMSRAAKWLALEVQAVEEAAAHSGG